jgi:hypothetical protein
MSYLDRTLTTLFAEPPVFISDSTVLVDQLRDAGYPGMSFADAASQDAGQLPAAVVCPISARDVPKREFFTGRLDGAAMLFLPFDAFDPSVPAVRYGLDLLSTLDIRAHVAGVTSLVQMLERTTASVSIATAGATAELLLSDDIHILNAKTHLDITPGEWVAISQYLEVTLVPRKSQHVLGFSLSGELRVDGCAVAAHRFFPDDVGPHAERAWQVIESTRDNGGFPLLVTVEDSRLRSVLTATGVELFPMLLECVDPREGPVVFEVAFASATLPPAAIDWRINSQFNEAAGGVHVAIGSGLHGAHIDFICPDAQITPR